MAIPPPPEPVRDIKEGLGLPPALAFPTVIGWFFMVGTAIYFVVKALAHGS